MSGVEIKLADLCEVITKGTTPSNIGAEFTEDGIKYIRSEMLTSSKYITEDGFLYISEDTHNKLKRSQLKAGDILFSMAGVYLGKTAILRKCDVPSNTNQAVALIRVIPEKCNREFVYYYLNLPEVVKSVNSITGQAAQPNINLKQIGSIPILLPSREIQDQIVFLVSAYDGLIENNQKQIKLLEEAAQRLYKEWFEDLRFPGHETTAITDGIPEGWKKCLLSEIIGYEIGGGWGEEEPNEKCDVPAYVIRGTDLYGVTHGDSLGIPYRYHAKKNLEARKLSDGDIVFEVSGGSKTEGVARTVLIRSAMLEQWNESVMCASFCKLIRAKNQNHAQLLYDALQYMRASGKTTEYDKRSASSIVNYRWKDFLATEVVLIPDEIMLKKYNVITESMYQLIVQKSIAIEKAKDARDRLLPKLMSGEIEV